MNRKEFEDKYLKHNFFWIEDEAQAKKIQKILIEFGFLCHTGKPELITWNREFSSLVTFQPDKYHKTKYFQKGSSYCPGCSYGQPRDYQNFIKDYNDLKINENKVKELKLTKQMKEEKMEIQIKRLVTLAKKCGKLLNNADEQTAKEMFITFYRGAPWSDMYAITFGNVEIGFYSSEPEITFPVEATADDLKDICEDVTEFLSHLSEGNEK